MHIYIVFELYLVQVCFFSMRLLSLFLNKICRTRAVLGFKLQMYLILFNNLNGSYVMYFRVSGTIFQYRKIQGSKLRISFFHYVLDDMNALHMNVENVANADETAFEFAQIKL